MSRFRRWVGSCLRKRRFPTVFDAEARANRILRGGGPQMRVYGCPSCQGYHLTRWSLSQQQDLGRQAVS